VKPVINLLEERVSATMAAVAGQANCRAIVKPCTEPRFGDYQANGVMPLAKRMKTNSRKLAAEVVSRLELSDICEPPGIAGPGFINFRLKPAFVADRLLQIHADRNRLGIDKTDACQTVVVDFSSPNIAKQMHVGHLRSTIIGDCICRLLEFLGHKVIRQNHIGDWGTQFGMLCALFEKKALEAGKTGQMSRIPNILPDLEAFYKEAKQLFDSDKDFADRSRTAVVELHLGDQLWVARWGKIVAESEKHYQEIYDRLNVALKPEHIRGESFYADKLADVVSELQQRGFAVESDGAICIFPPGFKNPQGKPLAFIIRKSDGAYLYATTDLAALRYRIRELKADRIIYVTDARQKLHFQMLFTVSRMAGWAKEGTDLVHVTFGSVLGENGKPLKTRSGENVKLKELLEEALRRARRIVEEKNPDLSAGKKSGIALAVGIGALKYADYANNRTSDYIFSFDKMLAMEGNTAPYMQYAYARIKSIERKALSRGASIHRDLTDLKRPDLTDPAELDLAKQLIRYGQTIQAAAADYRPNYLTGYLYQLAQKFSVFYTNCPVLDADPQKKPTRLLLCDLAARTIRHGLSDLLGIDILEQM